MSLPESPKYSWSLPFLESGSVQRPYALVILNQPFSAQLLRRLWTKCSWRCCADGGANRLYDALKAENSHESYIPDLIMGDLDSLRRDARECYAVKGVPIMCDPDQYATDLMKCVKVLTNRERSENIQYDLIILGGLSGRLDQTVHTLSYVHKLRKVRKHTFVVTDDSVAWVLDEGEHSITVNHKLVGKTCGLLPLGVESSNITTRGLQWNLINGDSSFDGLVSTSNHLVPSEPVVWIKTSRPIWWTVELREAVKAVS